ncbi:meiosis-specific with OB domain-containing protein [Caerostris extrusa]|uniref:Meiosis-specific with OB domain-containing protein n=1 Tax=Caerostris extrusa TaxID=172846 RepID=A0AAV4Q4I3_CAEEX|nr:meiosis-specific with OB domain-containing protein [Caerostris extrusa]
MPYAGEESAITTLSTSFTIGDIVKIKNPQIIERQPESDDEKFKPPVNSQTAEGLTVNLLVAVREIGCIQTVKTKDGREVKKLQITVFDQSHPVFHILIWEEETANFIVKYCSKRSVMLISNIKVSYNNYMKEMIGTSGGTTIFIQDPDIPDARVLYQYAMKISLPDDVIQNESKYSDSTTVYTIEQIIKLMNKSEVNLNEIQGTLQVMISSFDIDSTNKISSFRCPGCIQVLEKQGDKCINGACEIGSGMKNLPAEEMYDIPLSLADNTGCIERCLLLGQVAENLLGLNVQDFLRLSAEDKTKLKWNYLFERMTVQFKVTQPSVGNGKYNFRIISCKKCD